MIIHIYTKLKYFDWNEDRQGRNSQEQGGGGYGAGGMEGGDKVGLVGRNFLLFLLVFNVGLHVIISKITG